MKLWEFIKAVIRRLLGKEDNVICYITGEGTLPLPLSEDEEKAALKKLKQGDSDVRELLIVHNLRLVCISQKNSIIPALTATI